MPDDRTPADLVSELVERLRPLPAAEVVELLRPLLDRRPVEPLVEYLGGRLRLAAGERQVRFEFSDGHLRRTRIGHEPIGNQELEELARA